MNEFWTVAEVAARLRLSRSQVYALVSRKEIPHTRLGKRIVILDTDLVGWVNAHSWQVKN